MVTFTRYVAFWAKHISHLKDKKACPAWYTYQLNLTTLFGPLIEMKSQEEQLLCITEGAGEGVGKRIVRELSATKKIYEKGAVYIRST